MNIFREKYPRQKNTSSMDTVAEAGPDSGGIDCYMKDDGRYCKTKNDVLSEKNDSPPELDAGWQRSSSSQTEKSDCEN